MTLSPGTNLVDTAKPIAIDDEIVRDGQILASGGDRPSHLAWRDRAPDAYLRDALGAQGIAAARQQRHGLADPIRDGDGRRGVPDPANQTAPPRLHAQPTPLRP